MTRESDDSVDRIIGAFTNQSSMKSFVAVGNRVTNNRQMQLDFLLAKMIITDNLSLTIVSRQGFRQFISGTVQQTLVIKRFESLNSKSNI